MVSSFLTPPFICTLLDFSTSDCGIPTPLTSSKAAGKFNEARHLRNNAQQTKISHYYF